jgi:exopolyphosphatase/guanosine-5'-triphosphate,3'-diphosphate pyrophosphatase
MPRERRATLPYLHPGRVDVIAAGAVVWQAVIERVAAVAGLHQVITSEHDILDGIAWSLVGR